MAKKQIDEYDFVDEIIRITRSIKKLYDRLYALRNMKQQDSVDFKKNLEYLRTSIEVEETLYDECPNYRRCFELIDQFFSDEKKDDDSVVIVGFDESDNSLIKRRIQDNLFNRINLGESLHNIMCEFANFHIDNLVEMVETTVSYLDSVAQDVKRTVLFFLNTEMDSLLTKKDAFKFIYNMVFIDKSLENFFLLDEFNLPSQILPNSDIISSALNIDSDQSRALKDKYVVHIVSKSISILVSMNDDKILTDKNMAKVVIISCIIRAGLLFASEETVKELRERFEEYINLRHYRNVRSTTLIGEEFVFRAFRKFEKDQKQFVKVRRD